MTKRQPRAMRRTATAVLTLLAVPCVFIGTIFAQTETGSVSGTVTDPTGSVVPNAKVTVKNNATNGVRGTTTGASGVYTVTNLQPADYTVTVEAPGFSSSQAGVKVAVGSSAGLDVKLAVGQTGTTVEISEAAV